MHRLTPLAAAALLVTGCANSPTPNYDARYGDAVRQARQLQTLNPTPSTAAVQGMDGRAAAEAATRYQDSFKKPDPVVNVINIGGQIGGGR
ncbi:MAG TPA: hypothetical protein VD970_15865 [Acetobacteraceae bacterium]|nr:hypothetical protein [Acetobacteraceae bacterium]